MHSPLQSLWSVRLNQYSVKVGSLLFPPRLFTEPENRQNNKKRKKKMIERRRGGGMNKNPELSKSLNELQ